MDIERLNEAFNNFTAASKSLETYYGLLQERVRYLTSEIEKKNRQLNNALAEAERSKDFLNAILHSLEEAIIVVDPEERVSMVNRAAEEFLGLCPADAIGKIFASLDFTIIRDGSDTYLHVNGKKYNVILSSSTVFDSEGHLRGRVVLIKDITRLREMEVHHERNQRLIAMGEMAAKIVHEIRNPLCSIELFSSMLESDLEKSTHKKLARGISTGINNLNNILTNMLFFAKPHKPVPRNIRLDRVVEDSVMMFLPMMESRRIRIERVVFGCEIDGDPELLKQVFMNIIINAIQSMPDGGRVGIDMHKCDRSVVVDVSDSGEGIKHEHMERIFDPFFSTKDTGTGLGLAIASKIMQAHGGYIKVRSEEGKGSTFSLYFPSRDTDGSQGMSGGLGDKDRDKDPLLGAAPCRL